MKSVLKHEDFRYVEDHLRILSGFYGVLKPMDGVTPYRLEMQAKGMNDTFEQVLEDLKKRDDQDMNRPVEPLRQAPDAVLVDTTNLTFDEAVDAILKIVEANRHG